MISLTLIYLNRYVLEQRLGQFDTNDPSSQSESFNYVGSIGLGSNLKVINDCFYKLVIELSASRNYIEIGIINMKSVPHLCIFQLICYSIKLFITKL